MVASRSPVESCLNCANSLTFESLTEYPSWFCSRYSATATFAAEPSHGLIAQLIVVPELFGTLAPAPDELLDTSLHAAATRASETAAQLRSARLRDLILPPSPPGSLPGSHLLLLLRRHGAPGTFRRTIQSGAGRRRRVRRAGPSLG